MKVLLIGPYPPPHGGISVHIAGIERHLAASGVTCRVLDTGQGRLGLAFVWAVLRHALDGWTFHLHTNGHNVKSWLLAWGCGMAGRFSGGSILTLHSGMVPSYLEAAPAWRRRLAAVTCSLYQHVIAVSPEIRGALLTLALDSRRIEVLPAFLKAGGLSPSGPELHRVQPAWIGQHRPLFSTVLFFRPEYGFNLLVEALARVKCLYPSFGCLVMGSGEQRAQAQERIREAGLEESVLLLGDVDHDACLASMAACDAFLRPTLEDGDSISVREALSMGVPVVASRVGTRPAGAILFRPGDVDEMLAAIELAMTVKIGNQAAAAGCMDRLMEIYRQVDGSEGIAYA
jgi:glycosyltransferase involved in cell wall biosynthesis